MIPPLSDARKRWLTFIIVTIPAIFLIFLLLFVKHVIFPRVLAEFIRLRQNSDASLPLITQHWAAPPADIPWRFYFWNTTNADEVIYEGALPRLVECGPYVYLSNDYKENLTWSEDGNTVSYRNKRVWQQLSREQSCPTCREDDTIIVPNVVYAAMAHIASKPGVHPITKGLFDLGTLITGSGPFKTVEVGQMILYSYDDPMVSLKESPLLKGIVKKFGGTLFGTKIPEQPKVAGIIPFHNHTLEAEFTVLTGKSNIEDVTRIVSYGGMRSTEWGNSGEELQDCIEGAFGKQFRTPEDKWRIFTTLLGRSFELDFHEERLREWTPAYVYRINHDEYNTNSEKRKGMRYENEEGIDYFPTWPACPSERLYNPNDTRCADVDCSKEVNLCDNCCDRSRVGGNILTPPGFFPQRVLPARLDRVPMPVFISPPHMLWAPEEVRSLYVGQHPDEDKHRPVEWIVNPTLGASLHADAKIQMNLPMWRSDAMTQSSSLPNIVVPFLWLQLEIVMHEDVKFLVFLSGSALPFFLNAAMFLLLLVAFVSLSVIALDKTTRLLTEKAPARQFVFKLQVVAGPELDDTVSPV